MEEIVSGITRLGECWDDEVAISVLEVLRVVDLADLRGKKIENVVFKCPEPGTVGSSLCYLLLCYVLVWSPHRVKCDGLTLSNEPRQGLDVGILDVIQMHRVSGIETQVLLKKMIDQLPLGYLVYCALQLDNLPWNGSNKVCMDLYICKVMNGNLDEREEKLITDSDSSNEQLMQLYNRALIFPGLITETLFEKCYRKLIIENGVEEMLSLPNVSLSLRIIMEIVDQPDINFFKYPRLVALLLINLIYLAEDPSANVSNIHKELNRLGTTHTLIALFSYLQYNLTTFLFDFTNVAIIFKSTGSDLDMINNTSIEANFKNSKSNEYQFPSWFDKTMRISLPPIPKSSFIFEKKEKIINTRYHDTFERLLMCLLYSISISTKFFNQYNLIGVNPFEIDSTEEINLKHSKFQLMKYVHQLVYIPSFSTLFLTEQIHGYNSGLLTNHKTLAFFANVYQESTKNQIISILLLNENVALYQLLRFISRVSIDDLTLQRIAISLILDLLFNSGQGKFKSWCKQKDLCRSAIKSYIHLWNDGTDIYSDIYNKVVNSKQPQIESKRTILAEYLDLLPDSMKFQFTNADEITQRRTFKTPQAKYTSSSIVSPSLEGNSNKMVNPFLPTLNKLAPIIESTDNSNSIHTTLDTNRSHGFSGYKDINTAQPIHIHH